MTDTTASSVPLEQNDNWSVRQPGEPSPQPPAQSDSGWESVAFPGQLPTAAISGPDAEPLPLADAARLSDIGSDMSAISPDINHDAAPPEPAPEDLVQLIQDLNQCNDALLLRVTELEEALERSQIALQSEIERTPASAVGLPVDRVPGPVQQQIAQLLSELDIANDGLRRTTIHNETLQTDLEVNRQRVAQLERECTLLQQRFSEKSTALQQAEATCRDLKARLHRQQRYTLQFKAALEKCLNMAPGAGAAGITPGTTAGVLQGQLLSPSLLGEDAGQPVAMPRSQQIQPWSGGQASLVNNPSLTQLLRGLRGPGPATPEPVSPPAAPDPVAELPAVAEAQPALVNPTPAPASPDPWLEEKTAPADPIAPATVFTEPSPWGEPIAMAPPTPAAPVAPVAPVIPAARAEVPAPAAPVATTPEPMTAAPARPAKAEAALPSYVMTSAKASPSPLVYPLRSQKKISSIAAVELPSFGRTVRRR